MLIKHYVNAYPCHRRQQKVLESTLRHESQQAKPRTQAARMAPLVPYKTGENGA